MQINDIDCAYQHVGQQLKQLRLERGLTQAKVSRIISVSPQQYQKYEEAQSKCSLNYLIALADYYGITVNAFLPPIHKGVANPDQDTPIATEADLLARLVTAFVRLDGHNEKLRFVQLVEAIGPANNKRGAVRTDDERD